MKAFCLLWFLLNQYGYSFQDSDVFKAWQSLNAFAAPCYELFTNLDEVKNLISHSEKLEKMHHYHESILDELANVVTALDHIACFDLTPNRNNKWDAKNYTRLDKTLNDCFSEIATSLQGLLSLRQFSDSTLSEDSNQLIPPIYWKESLNSLCDALSFQSDQPQVTQFFQEQFSFYESLSLYFSVLSDLLKAMKQNPSKRFSLFDHQEIDFKNICDDLQQSFQFEPNLFATMFKKLEYDKIFAKQKSLEEALLLAQKFPLLTEDGCPIGLIPDDEQNRFFVFQDDGSIQMPIYEDSWDYQQGKYKKTLKYLPVVIDENTHLINAPLSCAGKPCPVPAYVTLNALQSAVQNNIDKSSGFIEKICSQFQERPVKIKRRLNSDRLF